MTQEAKNPKCPPHHWIVNWDDVGVCKYCGTVHDFGKELRLAKVRRKRHAPVEEIPTWSLEKR